MFNRSAPAICAVGFLLATLQGGVGLAASPPPDLPTDAIAPYVPPGWKLSKVIPGANDAEQAEFTPTGVPTPNFRDLVGYSMTPLRHPIVNAGDFNPARSVNASMSTRCTASTVRERTPPLAPPGWRYVQAYCLIASGPAAGEVDLTFQGFCLRPRALFTVWRSWRGTKEEFAQKVEGTGFTANNGQEVFNTAAVDRATPVILKTWALTFTRVELCDLDVGEVCPSFGSSGTALLPVSVDASVEIKGSHELTGRQALQEQAKMFGAPAKFAADTLAKLKDKPTAGVNFVQIISPSSFDWSAPSALSEALVIPLLGAKADGGLLVAIDEASSANSQTRARMQAYIVRAAHVLWALGIAPDRVTVRLTRPTTAPPA